MDEQMLRRALMEASLERFRDVLEGADRDWNWSPRYLRSRTRLLADPFGWAKRMARPVWKRAVRAAACAALACLVTLGGLMAVSPTVRAAVLGWLREITENGIFYTALGNWDGAENPEPPGADRSGGRPRRLAAVRGPGGLCADGPESQGELGLLEVL